MPNYVRNVLVVVGKNSDKEKFMDFIGGKNGLVDFEKILPLPENSKKDLHDWKISNWGSTNAVDCIRNRDDIISFSTSWTPPLQAVETLVQKFPELDFRYYWANDDLGADCGMKLYEDGELIEEIRPYHLVYNYCWDSIKLIA